MPAMTNMHLSCRYCNSKEHGNKVWLLKEVPEDGFSFVHKPFFGATEFVKVPFDQVKNWKKYKGTAPAMCPDDLAVKLMVRSSKVSQEDLAKSLVQSELLQIAQDNALENGSLLFTVGPTACWAKKAFTKQKALKLYPSGIVSKVKDEKNLGKVFCQYHGVKYAISSYKSNTEFQAGKGVLDPFFWVKCTDEPEAVNMILAKEQTDGEVEVPYLTNCKAIKTGDQLLQLNPKVEENQPAPKRAKK